MTVWPNGNGVARVNKVTLRWMSPLTTEMGDRSPVCGLGMYHYQDADALDVCRTVTVKCLYAANVWTHFGFTVDDRLCRMLARLCTCCLAVQASYLTFGVSLLLSVRPSTPPPDVTKIPSSHHFSRQ